MSTRSQGVPTFRELGDELETVLEKDLGITGNYYSFQDMETREYGPKLHIEGLGSIPLPLSPEDAERIISVASQAPYGRGAETLIDTKVRDTYQIEPSLVKFDMWGQNTMVEELYRQLGVFSEPGVMWDIKRELYKLLIYKTGSHFLPHQDSEKTRGMFATMVILLPSQYTGGEIHLQHGSQSHIIDTASKADRLQVLGWFTDVVHEIKPVTSGYRLALSFNLVHPSREIPQPHLGLEDPVMTRLKSILEKWAVVDETSNDLKVIVYMLNYQYSKSNLNLGMKALKGRDAPLAACLQAATREAGYRVLLGHMHYHISGMGRLEPGLSDGEDEDDRPDEFYNIWERQLTVENFVDLDGASLGTDRSLSVEPEGMLPRSCLKNKNPDESDSEPYMGNDGNTVEYWYRRTALVIFSAEYDDEILYPLGGIKYALVRLQQQGVLPSEKNRELARKVLKDHRYYVTSSASHPDDKYGAIHDCALQWKDIELWRNILKTVKYTIVVLGQEKLVDAARIFGFDSDAIKQSFETIFKTKQDLKCRLELIHVLSAHAGESRVASEQLSAWYHAQRVHVFSNLDTLVEADILTLVDFISDKGPTFTFDVVFPQLKSMGLSFDIAWGVTKAIYKNRDSILRGRTQETDSYGTLLMSCVDLTISLLFSDLASKIDGKRYKQYDQKDHISSVLVEMLINGTVALLELCISVGFQTQSARLLEKVLQMKKTPSRLEQMFIPLTGAVLSFLKKGGIPVTRSPFDQFFTAIIEEYFDCLPPLPDGQELVRIRTVGCGCLECDAVDHFIVNCTLKEQEFDLLTPLRHHIEDKLILVEELVFFSSKQHRQANPHGLHVGKHNKTILTQEWQTRFKDAIEFLTRFGTMDEIQSFMGPKYDNIQQNLSNIARATGIESVNG